VVDTIIRTVRYTFDTVVATAAALPRRRVIACAAAIVILVALVLLVPMPTALQLRDWATSLGPWFPLAFFLTHVVVTVFPFPRTAFTLAAGLLFGSLTGVVIAVFASTASALIAVLAIRGFGWRLDRLADHPALAMVNARLRQRGWLAVLSLRFIPAVPFSVINYAAGVSAVRLAPYTAATVVGLLPGTAAVVVLGDAFTGSVDPMLALISVGTALVGLAGLYVEVRLHRRDRSARGALLRSDDGHGGEQPEEA